MLEKRMPRVLAVDDDPTWLEQVPLILEGMTAVEVASSVPQALEILRVKLFDIVLLDLNFQLGRLEGLEVFRSIHALDRGADTIVVSGESNPTRLVEVFNAGVSRFLPKPATPAQVRKEVADVMEKRELRLMASRPSRGVDPFVGSSVVIRSLRALTDDVIASGVQDILILGPTGTGKEILARHIATQIDPSARFLPLHCGAINEGIAESELFGCLKGAFTGADRDRPGIFEAAGGGIVFLDEIGEMPVSQQAKLLRVIQERRVQRVGSFEERPVSFRSVSATHVNLPQAVAEGRFREDLLYRLGKATIQIPSLASRREDIPALVHSFGLVGLQGQRIEIAPRAMEILQEYPWPGNIRQLRTVSETLALRTKSSLIRESDVLAVLPDAVSGGAPGLTVGVVGSYGKALMTSEKRRFEAALTQARGNRNEAAKLLGLSRATYFRRARELGLISRGYQRLSPIV